MLPHPTTEEPTTDDDDGGPSSSGLSAAEIGGIVGGSVGFVVILIIVSLVIFFRCQPKKGKLHLIRLFCSQRYRKFPLGYVSAKEIVMILILQDSAFLMVLRGRFDCCCCCCCLGGMRIF